MQEKMLTPLRHLLSSLTGVIRGRSDTLADDGVEVPDTDLRIRRLGYTLILTLLLGFIVWASVAPLESAARARGSLQVEGNRKSLQHLEGGIVSEILVSEGDFVEHNQVLLTLDMTQAKADLRRLQGRLWAAQASVDRLVAERNEDESIVFERGLSESQDPRAISAMENERTLFAARRAALNGELQLINQRRSQYEQQLEGATLVAASKAAVAASIESEIKELQGLLEEGYVDKQRITALERSFSEIVGTMADLDSRIAVAEVSIREAELQAAQLNKRFKTEVTDALKLADERLFDSQELFSALSDKVARAYVKAPVAGVVLDVKPNVVGAVVAPGQPLLSIVPDAKELVVSAKLLPMDIDRVKIGQDVELRFSVFKGAYTISGRLKTISADSLIDEITGTPYYSAKIELIKEDLALLKGKELKPGMPVDVLIKTGRRTFMAYLTSSMRRNFNDSLIED